MLDEKRFLFEVYKSDISLRQTDNYILMMSKQSIETEINLTSKQNFLSKKQENFEIQVNDTIITGDGFGLQKYHILSRNSLE